MHPLSSIQVVAERDKLENCPPLLVKISPDLSHEERRDIASAVCAEGSGVDGLIVTNATTSRPRTLQNPSRVEKGGLTGEPLRDMATESIRDMYRLTNGEACTYVYKSMCCFSLISKPINIQFIQYIMVNSH